MKLLRGVLWLLPLSLLLAVAAAAGAVWMMADAEPALPDPPAISQAAAEQLLKRLSAHDPRRLRTGQRRDIRLSADELNLLTQEIGRRLPGTRLDARPDADAVHLRASLAVPAPLSRWINIETRITITQAGQPALGALRIGRLSLPASVARPLVRRAAPHVLSAIGVGIDPQRLLGLLEGIDASPEAIVLRYVWSAELWKEGLQSILPAGEADRLGFYHEALVRTVIDLRQRHDDDLLHAMQPLFALAVERSEGGDAQAEQRAAVLALALFVHGRHPRDLLPQAAAWLRVPRLTLTLRGREDLSQHYIGSALLTLHAGAAWADAIGLTKELRDARVGSGFSFTDLLADRAGTRLGEQIAAGRGDIARRFAGGLPVDQVLPPIDGLPELMPEGEFRRRFGGIGTPAYTAMIDDIEARLAKLDLYR